MIVLFEGACLVYALVVHFETSWHAYESIV